MQLYGMDDLSKHDELRQIYMQRNWSKKTSLFWFLCVVTSERDQYGELVVYDFKTETKKNMHTKKAWGVDTKTSNFSVGVCRLP